MLLEIGQGLYLNPDYIYKMDKGNKSITDTKILYTIIIYVASNKIDTYNGNVYRSEDILVFDTDVKRDEYFVYLFNLINDNSRKG